MTEENYILLGPAGSGKSTQAELLCTSFHLIHIDIGAELRATAKENTPLGERINNTINHKRELAPDEVMQAVLEKALARTPAETGILLDGAPRRASQIDEVLEVLERSGRTVKKVIYIHVPEEISIERISKRFLCLDCGRPYILGKDIQEGETLCPVCGGTIAKRQDDTEEGIRKRFQIFYQDTMPVIEYFKKAGKLVTVEGNQEVEKTFEAIRASLILA